MWVCILPRIVNTPKKEHGLWLSIPSRISTAPKKENSCGCPQTHWGHTQTGARIVGVHAVPYWGHNTKNSEGCAHQGSVDCGYVSPAISYPKRKSMEWGHLSPLYWVHTPRKVVDLAMYPLHGGRASPAANHPPAFIQKFGGERGGDQGAAEGGGGGGWGSATSEQLSMRPR